MKWFEDALKDIYHPYNLRGLYNRNKMLVLDGGMYQSVMNKIDYLKNIHASSSLDLNTLNHLQEDIESDYVELLRRRDMSPQTLPEPPTKVSQKFRKIESDKEVLVDFGSIRTDLLTRVEKEVIVQAILNSKNRGETAKMLGISYRTLTNKLKKHFNFVITD